MSPVSTELLRRFDLSGPRYTSYPTADRFVEAFTEADYIQALNQRRTGAASLNLPLSRLLHLKAIELLVKY